MLGGQNEGNWDYPNHQELLRECGLFPIEIYYIERRRGTIRRYLEECRSDLLTQAYACKRHYRDAHKLFWWEQEYIIR